MNQRGSTFVYTATAIEVCILHTAKCSLGRGLRSRSRASCDLSALWNSASPRAHPFIGNKTGLPVYGAKPSRAASGSRHEFEKSHYETLSGDSVDLVADSTRTPSNRSRRFADGGSPLHNPSTGLSRLHIKTLGGHDDRLPRNAIFFNVDKRAAIH